MHGARLWITKFKADQAVLIAFAHHIAWNSICNPIGKRYDKVCVLDLVQLEDDLEVQYYF